MGIFEYFGIGNLWHEIAGVVPGFLFVSLMVRPIYRPLVGEEETLFAPVMSTFFIVLFSVYFFHSQASQPTSSGVNGYTLIFGLIIVLLAIGWVGNLFLDILMRAKDRLKLKYRSES